MRTVIISHNNNPIYSFFEPIVKFAWKKLGWDCKCYIEDSPVHSQCIRLYVGSDFEPDTLLMTSDIDMIPLGDYWKPKEDEVTCYGRDLSEEHQPVCYVAMPAKYWDNTFGDREDMLQDIKTFGDHWTVDQDILTHNLSLWAKTEISRGINPMTRYPIGRVDRSAWDRSLQQPLRIDAHLLRPGYTDENWPKILDLIKECLNPTVEEVEALEIYRREFIK